MSAQATLEGVRVDHVQRRDLDEDSSARGAVRAVLRAALVDYGALDGVNSEPLRVADVGAGFGCWSSVMREHAREQGWPVHITGIEVNEDRGPSLRKWCDDVYIGGYREMLRVAAANERHRGGETFDIIIGNPPFAHVLRQGRHPEPGKRTPYKPVDETMVPTLLRHAPAVLLLHTSGAFDDSAHGREVWRKYQPAAEWPLGRLGFRGDGKTDNRCYTASLWLRNHSGPTSKLAIEEIGPADRRWSGVIPGSESPDVARALGLPMAGDP